MSFFWTYRTVLLVVLAYFSHYKHITDDYYIRNLIVLMICKSTNSHHINIKVFDQNIVIWDKKVNCKTAWNNTVILFKHTPKSQRPCPQSNKQLPEQFNDSVTWTWWFCWISKSHCTLTGSADTVRTAGWWPTHQRVTGGALPAVLTPTASVHTVSVSAAVCRLAAPRVNAQDGGDGSSTAPPAVRFTGNNDRAGGEHGKTHLDTLH